MQYNICLTIPEIGYEEASQTFQELVSNFGTSTGGPYTNHKAIDKIDVEGGIGISKEGFPKYGGEQGLIDAITRRGHELGAFHVLIYRDVRETQD